MSADSKAVLRQGVVQLVRGILRLMPEKRAVLGQALRFMTDDQLRILATGMLDAALAPVRALSGQEIRSILEEALAPEIND